MPERIMVTGIYRSGTSLNAELVRRWGSYEYSDQCLLCSIIYSSNLSGMKLQIRSCGDFYTRQTNFTWVHVTPSITVS